MSFDTAEPIAEVPKLDAVIQLSLSEECFHNVGTKAGNICLRMRKWLTIGGHVVRRILFCVDPQFFSGGRTACRHEQGH